MANGLPPDLRSLLESNDASSRQRAWASFLERYSRLILHTARSMGGGYDAAMDRYRYVIEGLHRDDFKRLKAYVADGRSQFTTWLVVVSRRLCHDYYRSRYGRDRGAHGPVSASGATEVRRKLADLIAGELDPSLVADTATRDPEHSLRKSQLHEALQSAVMTLGPRDRLLLKLRFEDDVPVREISEAMRFPSVFHVYRRLKTVLGLLREQLIDSGITDPLP